MTPRPTPPRWPPLVGDRGLPLWLTVRDVLLTALAWCVVAWLMRQGLLYVADMLTPPFGQETFSTVPDWPLLRRSLGPFGWVMLPMVLMLMVVGLSRRHTLRRRGVGQAPQPLAWAEHLQAPPVRLDEGAPRSAEAWHAPILTVTFDEAHKITGLR